MLRFLKAGDKVKVTIMFRGREQSRPELGFRLLRRLEDEIQELGYVEASAKQDGRNMIMVIAPHKSSKARGQRAREQRVVQFVHVAHRLQRLEHRLTDQALSAGLAVADGIP